MDHVIKILIDKQIFSRPPNFFLLYASMLKLTLSFATKIMHLPSYVILFQKVRKPKGVDGLIEINNPNRNQKAAKKVTDLDTNTEATLSRREREELEKQQAQQRYQKLHAEGKTEQAQRDLARLAIIRKQREEAAKKKEEVKKGNEWVVHRKITASPSPPPQCLPL